MANTASKTTITGSELTPEEVDEIYNKDREEKLQRLDDAITDAQNRKTAALEDLHKPVKGSYDTWLSQMRKNIETPDQKEQREANERKRRRIAALGDGIIALSNTLGAMNGAKPVQQTSFSQAEEKKQKEALAKRTADFEQFQKINALNQKEKEKAREAKQKRALEASKNVDEWIKWQMSYDQKDRATLTEQMLAASMFGLKLEDLQARMKHYANQDSAAIIRARNTGRGGSGNNEKNTPEEIKWWSSLSEAQREQLKKAEGFTTGSFPFEHGKSDEITNGGFNKTMRHMYQKHGNSVLPEASSQPQPKVTTSTPKKITNSARQTTNAKPKQKIQKVQVKSVTGLKMK